MSARKSSAPEGARDSKEVGRTDSGLLRKKAFSGVEATLSNPQALGMSTMAYKGQSFFFAKENMQIFPLVTCGCIAHAHMHAYTHPVHNTCGLRRLLGSTLPAILRVSLIGVPLRRWVGAPHRSWRVDLRPHRLLWIRWVRGRRPGAWIWWRVPLIHQGPAECT